MAAKWKLVTRWSCCFTAACPSSSGYLHNKLTGICFKIHNEMKQTWTDSRDICFEEGGDLIVLNTSEKFNYIVNTIRSSPGKISSTQSYVRIACVAQNVDRMLIDIRIFSKS